VFSPWDLGCWSRGGTDAAGRFYVAAGEGSHREAGRREATPRVTKGNAPVKAGIPGTL